MACEQQNYVEHAESRRATFLWLDRLAETAVAGGRVLRLASECVTDVHSHLITVLALWDGD